METNLGESKQGMQPAREDLYPLPPAGGSIKFQTETWKSAIALSSWGSPSANYIMSMHCLP